MKLWQKEGTQTDEFIERFTVGKDRELDIYLAPFDVLGTLAHIKMLNEESLLSDEDYKTLKPELLRIYEFIEKGQFEIEPGIEDVHSQVEYILTTKVGDAGKRIHAARSRNDQVLVDLKLYMREALKTLIVRADDFFNLLLQKSDEFKDHLLPGYTHLQVAMPSSAGLWFSAYAESITDDLRCFKAAYEICNQNPLGSAAGYGSSFPINRQRTTDLLGFDAMNVNVVYAQMGRGKTEKTVAFALATLAGTLSKLAMDATLYMSQNFGFFSFPDALTTGSSIMPHKKNPDVFEISRARCNQIQALPGSIITVINNLPSGYFRDLQVLKEQLIPAFETLHDTLDALSLMVDNIQIRKDIVKEDKYKFIFSVERVNELVLQGLPFRNAYKQVGEEIASGQFKPNYELNHSHEGSLGNLRLDLIANKQKEVLGSFHFEKVEQKLKELLKDN